MPLRYLEAGQVKLQSSAPAFVKPGHCYWCNKPLTGKAKKYCRPTAEDKEYYKYSLYPVESLCSIHFQNWWYSRPAYIRATFIRDNFTCQQCGFHQMMEDRPWLPDLSNLECDHIIPLARGGETSMDNLQTLCKKCNRKKATSVPSDLEDDLPPSRDNTKCPSCGRHGYRVLPWTVPPYYDPLMVKVVCTVCREESYIAPAPWAQRIGGQNERVQG